MKAILEFNLPEEMHEHRMALQARDWMYVVSEMNEYLRSQIKYQAAGLTTCAGRGLTKEASEALQAARDNLINLCNDNNININE